MKNQILDLPNSSGSGSHNENPPQFYDNRSEMKYPRKLNRNPPPPIMNQNVKPSNHHHPIIIIITIDLHNLKHRE